MSTGLDRSMRAGGHAVRAWAAVVAASIGLAAAAVWFPLAATGIAALVAVGLLAQCLRPRYRPARTADRSQARADSAPGRSPRHRRWSLLEGLIVAVMLGSALGDLPRELRLGPLTLVGMFTIFTALALAGSLLLQRSYPTRMLLRLLPCIAFLVWVGARSVWAPPDFYGIQNTLVFVTFTLCAVSAGLVAARHPERTIQVIGTGVRWTSVIALGLVGVSVASVGVFGAWLIGQRTLSLIGLVPLSWYLARLYFDGARALGGVSLWLAAIVLSSSRTATVAALLLLAIVSGLKLRRGGTGVVPAAGLLLVTAGVVGFLFWRVPAFNDHLFSGDTSLQVGDVRINANGRMVVWEAVSRSALERPWVGKGIASSANLVQSRFAGMSHPHNDYLRLWHDVGSIGLGLFLTALIGWALILAREWRRADREGEPAVLQVAGLLALFGLLVAMTTDNPVTYSPVMALVGLLSGAGLGASYGRERRDQGR